MVQELCGDCVGGPDHHLRHVLWGQAQLLARTPQAEGGWGWPHALAEATAGDAGIQHGRLAVRSPCRTTSRCQAHPACQHAQGPLVQVHDGVVLALVVVDLLRAEWGRSAGTHQRGEG